MATATIDVIYGKKMNVLNVLRKRISVEFKAKAMTIATMICGNVPSKPIINVFFIAE